MGELPPDLQQWMRFSPSKKAAIRILISKNRGNCSGLDFIFEAQKSNLDPWVLKELCLVSLHLWDKKMGGYPEWWFFSPPNQNKKRSRARTTDHGFWKVMTTKPKKITLDSGLIIGEKNILVFHTGRGKGKKTNWKIHEYSTPDQNTCVLCRLSCKHEKSIKDPNANDARPTVSSPATSKSFIEDSGQVWLTKASQSFLKPSVLTKSELLVASVFPTSEVHAAKLPENCDGTISITATVAECDDKHCSAHAAENQFGEFPTIDDYLEMEDMINELQQIDGSDALKSSSSQHNNPTISSDTADKSSLKELEFTGCLPYLNNCNQNSYSSWTARYEVPKATFSEVDLLEDGLSLFELPLEPPDGASQKNLTLVSIKDNGSCGGPDVELANAPVESTFQDFGGISKRKASSGLLNLESHIVDLLEDGLSLFELPLEPPDGTSQKNLTLVSIKDNGSCGGPDAELANARVESTFQDFGGINKRKASSGLLNLESHIVWTRGSSYQILQPDFIVNN